MRKLRSFGVNSDMLVTFNNVVICSLVMFASVCWDENSSKFDRGRLESIVKKKKKKKKKKEFVGNALDSYST